MKQIPLYSGCGDKKEICAYAKVDDGDYDFLMRWEWRLMKIYHTENKIFYARRYEYTKKTNGKQGVKAILMHRVLLGLTTRDQKGDHIDGNGLNNTRTNIRACTHSENMSNRKPSSKTGYLGVSGRRNGFIATMRAEGRTWSSPTRPTIEQAAIEYNKLALAHKKEHARYNNIDAHNPFTTTTSKEALALF